MKKYFFIIMFLLLISSTSALNSVYYDDASVDLVSVNFETNGCSGGVLFTF